MKIMVLGPVLWDSIWGHGQELTRILSKEHQITYLEPIVHSSTHSLSFQRTTKNPIPLELRIIKRNTSLGLNVIYGIYCELNNLYHMMKLDYNVLITYHTTCAFLATIFSRLTGRKVVLMYVDDLSEWYDPKIAKYVTRYFFTPLVVRFSNLTITTAHILQKSASKHNQNVICIPNGVDLNYFQKFNEISSHEEEFIIGFVGSFGDRINYEMLLDTAALLKDENNIKFLFAGGGDGFEYFGTKIEELNLVNIHLLGVIPHEEVPKVLNQMDVCVIPFKINRLTDCISPVKLFEYWAMGKPVISTGFYEIKKIAKGKVIFADNAGELKNAILALKNSDELRKKYADIGLHEVAKYDWNVLGRKYLKLIAALI